MTFRTQRIDISTWIISVIAIAITVPAITIGFIYIKETNYNDATIASVCGICQVLIGIICVLIVAVQLRHMTKSNDIMAQSNKLVARIKSLEFASLNKKDIVNSLRIINNYRKLGDGSLRERAPIDLDETIYYNLVALLNYFENIAVGVNHKILDEETMYEMLHGMTIDIYFFSEDFISYMRRERNYPRIWIELERLAIKWKQRTE